MLCYLVIKSCSIDLVKVASRRVPMGSPSLGWDIVVYVFDINQPNLPTPFYSMPWCNPLWLTGIKAPTNSLYYTLLCLTDQKHTLLYTSLLDGSDSPDSSIKAMFLMKDIWSINIKLWVIRHVSVDRLALQQINKAIMSQYCIALYCSVLYCIELHILHSVVEISLEASQLVL